MNAEQHWEHFRWFCREERRGGGPDPQVKIVAWATFDWYPLEAQQAAGYFVGPYTCGAAAALWGQLHVRNHDALTTWIRDNWKGLPHRRERRAIDQKAGRKLAECLISWTDWVAYGLPELNDAPYTVLYDSIRKHVRYFGRYATMKVLETLYQQGYISYDQDSICAQGAEFPRRTLGYLYPDIGVRSDDDSPAALRRTDEFAAKAKAELGQDMSWYDFETLLCNYRQSLDGKYPGRSHDREQAHWENAVAYWGQEPLAKLKFYPARAALFPHEFLGEYGDPPWHGARKDKEQELKAHYANLSDG